MKQIKIFGQPYLIHRSQRGYVWATKNGMTVLEQWMSDDNKRRFQDKPEQFEVELDRLEKKLIQRVKGKVYYQR